MTGTLLGWLRDVLTGLPSLIWQRKMKRKLRDLADRLQAFREERRAQKPSPTTDSVDRAYLEAVAAWNTETRRLFSEQFMPELRKLQDELDSREISDRRLWEPRDLQPQLRLGRIIARLRKLARRKRLLR